MLPDGEFEARVVKCEIDIREKEVDGEFIAFEDVVLTWEAVGGPYDGEQIKQWCYLSSEKATEISERTLKSAGWDGQDPEDLTRPGMGGLGSKPCRITVASEEYNGKTSRKVKRVKPMGGGDVKRVGLSQLGARF